MGEEKKVRHLSCICCVSQGRGEGDAIRIFSQHLLKKEEVLGEEAEADFSPHPPLRRVDRRKACLVRMKM